MLKYVMLCFGRGLDHEHQGPLLLELLAPLVYYSMYYTLCVICHSIVYHRMTYHIVVRYSSIVHSYITVSQTSGPAVSPAPRLLLLLIAACCCVLLGCYCLFVVCVLYVSCAYFMCVGCFSLLLQLLSRIHLFINSRLHSRVLFRRS